MVWLWFPLLAQAVPSFDAVQRAYVSSETLVLSREGEVVQRQRTDTRVRQGAWLTLDQVSPAFRHGLLLSEDRRFYEHSGVDWEAVSAAAWGRLWHQRTRGASTITMQLAGLLDESLRQRSGGRSVSQKLSQTLAAQSLERQWRKDQILEAYLNLVPFRGELVGLDALARTLFGKAPHGLDARESAIAVALIRAPNAPVNQVVRRACGVWQTLEGGAQHSTAGATARQSDCLGLEMLATAALQRRAWASSQGQAPHFARYALGQFRSQHPQAPAPQRLPTSLHAPLQRFAAQTLHTQLRSLYQQQVQDGAVLVLDNASGQVLAWVGSSGALSQAREVDAVLAQRQPGSTLKPFLYAQALAERRLTAASLLDDGPTQIATAGGLYIPQNYDRQFKGWVSVRTALAASLNVPAVRVLEMVSPDVFFRQLRQLGLLLRESAGYFGYSLALGSSDVSLLHLTNAFRALANGGRWSPVVWQVPPAGAPAPVFKPVLDASATFIVGDILSDRLARVPTFGSDSVLNTRFWTAVKTGTSKDMRDNWALGWSQHYTVGVWVGNASGAPMHDVSGTSGAAPVWAAIMTWLHTHQNLPSRAPTPPTTVVQQRVTFGPGADGVDAPPLEAARQEWFLAGTEQPYFAINTEAISDYQLKASGQNNQNFSNQSARIVAPTDGSILALDPDIPPQHQRMQLAATGGGAGVGLRWQIGQQTIGRGGQAAWLPWPGRHTVQLRNAQGQLLDSVAVEVRGAGVR